MISWIKKKPIASWLIPTVPIVIFYFVFFRYSVNVLWFDDFDPFPDFLVRWIAAASSLEKLRLLFEPNNEHRMVFGKLAVLLVYGVTDQLNFTMLHVVGGLFTLGTLYIVWELWRKSSLPSWSFWPIPFLLFQLQYHMVFLWAICSLQHQPVIFFVCLSMYLLAKRKLYGAIAAAVCASFAMSSGIFVWVGGLAVLIYRREWKGSALWTALAVVVVSLYFLGMSAQGNESSFDFFLKNPHLSVLGFFAFLGGLFDVFPNHTAIFTRSILPVVLGAISMIWVVVWLGQLLKAWFLNLKSHNASESQVGIARNTSTQPNLRDFCLGILFFLLVNAIVIGFLRPRFGFFVMIVSNYKLYPALFLIICYLTGLVSLSKSTSVKKYIFSSTILAAAIWIWSFFNYIPDIEERRKYLLINAYNQEHHAFGLGAEPRSTAAVYVDSVMKELVKKGIYKYPDGYSKQFQKAKEIKSVLVDDSDLHTRITDTHILVSENNLTYKRGLNSGPIVFLRNKEDLYVFKMHPNQYRGRNCFRHFSKGFYVEIPRNAVKTGTYELGLYYTLEGRAKIGIAEKIQLNQF